VNIYKLSQSIGVDLLLKKAITGGVHSGIVERPAECARRN